LLGIAETFLKLLIVSFFNFNKGGIGLEIEGLVIADEVVKFFLLKYVSIPLTAVLFTPENFEMVVEYVPASNLIPSFFKGIDDPLDSDFKVSFLVTSK
jgi:hypothetical protein